MSRGKIWRTSKTNERLLFIHVCSSAKTIAKLHVFSASSFFSVNIPFYRCTLKHVTSPLIFGGSAISGLVSRAAGIPSFLRYPQFRYEKTSLEDLES